MEFYVIITDGQKMISGSSQIQYAYWTNDMEKADKFYNKDSALSKAEDLSILSTKPISILKFGIVEAIDVEHMLGND